MTSSLDAPERRQPSNRPNVEPPTRDDKGSDLARTDDKKSGGHVGARIAQDRDRLHLRYLRQNADAVPGRQHCLARGQARAVARFHVGNQKRPTRDRVQRPERTADDGRVTADAQRDNAVIVPELLDVTHRPVRQRLRQDTCCLDIRIHHPVNAEHGPPAVCRCGQLRRHGNGVSVILVIANARDLQDIMADRIRQCARDHVHLVTGRNGDQGVRRREARLLQDRETVPLGMENGAVKLCADIADALSVAIDHHDLLTCRKQSPRQSNTRKSSTDNNRLHKSAHSWNISAL